MAIVRMDASAMRAEMERVYADAARAADLSPPAYFDGWANVLSSLGNEGDDPGTAMAFSARRALSQSQCRDLYIQDWVMGRFIDEVAEERFRAGYDVLIDDDPEMQHDVQAALDETHYQCALRDAAVWSRCYGGAIVWMVVDEGDDGPAFASDDRLLLPLPSQHGGLKDLRVYDRWWAWPRLPPYDRPPSYRIMDPFLGRSFEVDASRVLRYDGARVPNDVRLANLGWGGSYFERPFEAVRNFHASHAAATTIMQRYEVLVLAMTGLHAAVMAPGGDDVVGKRARALKRGISVANVALIDKDGESAARSTARMSGFGEVLDKQRDAVAGACSTPSARMFGQQQGVRAGADEDEQIFDRRIQSQQRDEDVPQIRKLLSVIMAGADSPTKGKEIGVRVEPRALRVAAPDDVAKMRLDDANADSIAITAGVLQPIEVRKSRYGGQKYGSEITLDDEITEAMELAVPEDFSEPKEAAEPGAPLAPLAKAGAEPEPEAKPNASVEA